MLEWLVTVGAAELGKSIFEQVLKLGQAAAEDYVKDFFRGCLEDGITAATDPLRAEVTKKAVAEALRAFLLLVTDELEDQELSKAEIRDRYDPALVQFVQDQAVKPILGKAFEKDCRAIDATALSTRWQQSTLRGQPFSTLPENFDWQYVGKEYLKKVRRIVRESPELRSLLDTQLLEDIARNTTQLSPGFDVANYRNSLHCSYGHLKLYAIDSTDRVDAIKLWNMFIEQTVREALPPLRYELPLDLKRQLQAHGQLESDLSPEALEHYRQDYFQQPARKVLEVVKPLGTLHETPLRAVILGDPGAGKSTLLQYLALEWVEGKTESLPLLIELRDYAISQSNNFLNFLHHGRGVDWQFDQQQLHQHLLEFPTLVMFDGLDEVFDRATQSAIIDDIIRFAQQYPNAQILITSRIIGYNPDRLQQAKFRHFTIQPLDTDEIHEFIDRWYTLALGNDSDKPRLVTRLKDAIANSTAIQNLADNPLLLTMMAILNRRQELPRDRADLYEQASRVLLYHWDVDHKRLQLPVDAIGRREKQEMLRAIAYEMQAGEDGLKGNLISSDRLTRIITDYLRDQGYSESREKAHLLIQQLRDRNFILCYRGADTYGFMHRTFLEYFCAVEIVYRFEKVRSISFEELRDRVFGEHWQDESWHEVLKLICGAIDAKFAGQLIEFLMEIEVDRSQFLEEELNRYVDDYKYDYLYGFPLKKEGLINLFLASECLMEVSCQNTLIEIKNKLLFLFKEEINSELFLPLGSDAAEILAKIIVTVWSTDLGVLNWLKTCIDKQHSNLPYKVVIAISQQCKGIPEILSWLKICAFHENWGVNHKAVIEIARNWKNHPDVLPWLKSLAQNPDSNVEGPGMAVQELSLGWKEDPEILHILKRILRGDNYDTRAMAVRHLAWNWSNDSELLSLFKIYARQDENEFVRREAVAALGSKWSDHPEILDLLKTAAQEDRHSSVRMRSVYSVANYYKDDLNTFEWLKEQARFAHDWAVRVASLEALTNTWNDYPEVFFLLKTITQEDPVEAVRESAVSGLMQSWKNEPETKEIITHLVQIDASSIVRHAALCHLIYGFKVHKSKDSSDAASLLAKIATSDVFAREQVAEDNPRLTALQFLARFYPTHPKTLELLRDRAINDPDEQLREWAQEQLKMQNGKLKEEEA